MLHRSSSSRRRRTSRSSASSPQTRGSRSAGTSPGRRASIAVSPVDSECISRNIIERDLNKSPRPSIVPDISLDTQDLNDEPPPLRSPRHSLIPESALSPRNSLIPEAAFSRASRHSLVPGDGYSRSARNSLVPDSALSPRNSLIPDTYNRSPRNSLVPESVNKSHRNSLVPDIGRSPRHSLVPDNNTYSSRLSLAPDFNRSPRNSLVPDTNRSPRPSLVPSESQTWNPKVSPNEELRSPRHSIAPDINRSPRGSIAPDSLYLRNSPRGSISSEYPAGDRSPRGSIGPENGHNRSPRGSIARNFSDADAGKSPRGSLTLTFQEPLVSERRASVEVADQYIKEINEKVSRATGVSLRTIERIIKEGSTSPEAETDKRFKVLKIKRNSVCTVPALEDYELKDFRNIIYNFHNTKNCKITVSALQEKLSNDLGWLGQATSLRRMLKNLGFKWRRAKNNRKLLIKKSEIRALRIDYLKIIQFFANSSVLLFLWAKRISTTGTLYQKVEVKTAIMAYLLIFQKENL
ncbi:hypothetical protein FQA39_LY14654 [Lamprigera yunnana]|nr:hypothetical protein FQA39_LY14654 [Lamprigera yunnana]